MDDYIQTIFIVFAIIFIFFVIIYIFIVPCNNNKNIENWVNYQQFPFGNIYTGSDAMCDYSVSGGVKCKPAFYEVIRYKKPYDWPRTQYVEYPIPHMHHPNP